MTRVEGQVERWVKSGGRACHMLIAYQYGTMNIWKGDEIIRLYECIELFGTVNLDVCDIGKGICQVDVFGFRRRLGRHCTLPKCPESLNDIR